MNALRSLRQEQVVLAVTLVVLGLLTWSLFSSAPQPRGQRSREAEAEFRHHAAPPIEVALPSAEATPALRRELFAPPRDTRPLAPLELVEPPRRPLPGLFPPSEPGPAPRAFGRWLRVPAVQVDVPDLFEDPQDRLASAGEEDAGFFDDAMETGARASAVDALIRDAAPPDDDAFAEETPAERTARYASYRERYDWIHRTSGQVEFGRIDNPDRYGLVSDLGRATEPILFVRIDPETGREWFRNVGAPAIPVRREELESFAFASTVANELEIGSRALAGEMTRGDFEEAQRLAGYAVRHRLEAPRALSIAEELYRRCEAYDPEDPEPKLGLAACYEAGFRFEEAFREYRQLLERFAHRPEVHVRLARLEERLLLHSQAEERLRGALAANRGSWEARYGLGAFLARRGRAAEAIEHLREANRLAPATPELLDVRVAIRLTLADALFALGQLAEAGRVYASARSADPSNQRALAGTLAVALYRGEDDASGEVEPSGGRGPQEDVRFELILVQGLRALHRGDYVGARDRFLLAVEADPLRAHRALGALAYLAHVTGNDAEALAFADQALERHPSDAYALYMRGRLLGLQDDYEGARDAFLGALEQELDFEDALVALGEMAFRLGRFEDAERYLERALGIESRRGPVHALRGVNLLRLGSVPEARAAFAAALELDPGLPSARAGSAWCAYLDGDVTEALILLANLDESRRDLPDDDPWRVWAREQIARVQDHVEKVEWRDNFNRKRLINGWITREGAGPIVSMEDGTVKIEGVFDRQGAVQVYREYAAGDFVSLSADVWIAPETNVHVGLFAARERQRRQARDVIAEASVARHKDGSLQVRFVRQGQPVDATDMQQALPTGEWVRLTIEKTGESSGTAVTIAMNGIPLVEDVRMASLGTATSPILVGLFAEGETGRQVRVRMDDAAIVFRGNR